MPRTSDGGRVRTSLSRRLPSPGDRWAIALLVAVPALLYVPLWLAGRPLLPGDDLNQNFPLRVLVGESLRSGHLPGWDPFIWSGTPLLAGWNAGALFPGTWLFAVLPATAAWTADLVATGAVAGVGMYALTRRLGCRPLASCLAGLAFADTGFMSGQVVHIGLVEGTSLTPWMLLAVDLLARPGTTGARMRRSTTILLGAAGALTVLAGDPRAVSSAAIATGIYALACCWRAPRAARSLLSSIGAAIALGAALSAIQWLPGLGFLHVSQRGVSAYSLFGAGSLHLGEIAALLVLPFVLGTNGNLGQPFYSGNYNLAEVTIGVGVVAVIAAFAFLPELLAPALRWRGGSRASGARVAPPPGRPLAVWYATAAVGVLLTLGSNTPFGRVLVDVPLFGGQRLQNRNAAILDIALVVLLAFFLDDVLGSRKRPATTRRAGAVTPTRAGPLDRRAARVLALVPVAWLVALVVWAWTAPTSLEQMIGVIQTSSTLMGALTPYLATALVLGIGAGVLVAAGGPGADRRRAVGLVALTLCDIAMYLVNGTFATAPVSLLASSTPSSAALAALAGPDGRFALYDPSSGAVAGPSRADLVAVGETDVNILRHLPSVQGYGSIVEAAYDAATGTHTVAGLDASRLDGPTFDALDLHTLLCPAGYLVQPLAAHEAVAVAGGPTVTATGAVVHGPSPHVRAAGARVLAPGSSAAWMLAAPASASRVTVVLGAGSGSRTTAVEIAVETPGARAIASRRAVRGGVATLPLGGTPRTEEVRVSDLGRRAVTVGAVIVSVELQTPARPAKPGTSALLLDGELQADLQPPRWVWSGTVDSLSAFDDTGARGLAWLEPAHSTSPTAAISRDGRVSTGATLETGSQTMHVVSSVPALLVRSETYSPGWTARLTPSSGGPTLVERVHPLGLVQAVPVPAGDYVVTWRYAPTEILAGLVASAAGLVALLGALLPVLVRPGPHARRQRRRAKAPPRTSRTDSGNR